MGEKDESKLDDELVELPVSRRLLKELELGVAVDESFSESELFTILADFVCLVAGCLERDFAADWPLPLLVRLAKLFEYTGTVWGQSFSSFIFIVLLAKML